MQIRPTCDSFHSVSVVQSYAFDSELGRLVHDQVQQAAVGRTTKQVSGVWP